MMDDDDRQETIEDINWNIDNDKELPHTHTHFLSLFTKLDRMY